MRAGIVGVLLAAGQSLRFGSDKLMYVLPSGEPMAVAAATHLKPACDRLIAVIRPTQLALANVLTDIGFELVLCAEASHGMGFSLAAAVNASPEASGWLVALADMPFVQPSSHVSVAQAIRSGASLAATDYMGRRGHPVGFSSKWFDSLTHLTGDEGARKILSLYPDQVALQTVDDEGVVFDMDRPDDLPSKTDRCYGCLPPHGAINRSTKMT
ncbi:MAG: nucleotidyltransferase family protein [Rhodoferax sp.]|nr:nucleotidyltransferase family protein [Rhodoferax sp.]